MLGGVSPEPPVLSSLAQRLSSAHNRFKQIKSGAQESEIKEIQQCAQDIFQGSLVGSSPGVADVHMAEAQMIADHAKKLYQAAEAMPEFLKSYHTMQADIESVQQQLKTPTPDKETLTRLEQEIEALAAKVDELEQHPVVESADQFRDDFREAKEKIAEGKKALAILTQAYRSAVAKEASQALPPEERELEAVHHGLEENIKLWFETATPLFRSDLAQGPMNKTEETRRCEEIADAILNHPELVTVEEKVEEGVTNYYITLKRQGVDLGTGQEVTKAEVYKVRDLIAGADFSQIHLDRTRVENFGNTYQTFQAEQAMTEDVLKRRVSSRFQLEPAKTNDALLQGQPSQEAEAAVDEEMPPEISPYLALSLAERQAIHIYTMDGPDAMVNFLLRNRPDLMFKRLGEVGRAVGTPQERCVCVKDALMHAAVLHSALAKLPDYEPAGPGHELLYRMERDLPLLVLEERMKLAQQGGVSNELGVLSYSHTKPVEDFWTVSRVGVCVPYARGKSIEMLSATPTEHEVVIPSTQIRWTGVQKFSRKGQDGSADTDFVFFMAEPVNQVGESRVHYLSVDEPRPYGTFEKLPSAEEGGIPAEPPFVPFPPPPPPQPHVRGRLPIEPPKTGLPPTRGRIPIEPPKSFPPPFPPDSSEASPSSGAPPIPHETIPMEPPSPPPPPPRRVPPPESFPKP